VAGALLASGIVVGLGAQSLPTSIYEKTHGPNGQGGGRSPQESVYYGLKIKSLVLPVPGHRLGGLRHLKERCDRTTPGEVAMSSLGALGSAGFLFLLGLVFVRGRRDVKGADVLRTLSILNVLSLLMATAGGFGFLFALLITPEIRAYS